MLALQSASWRGLCLGEMYVFPGTTAGQQAGRLQKSLDLLGELSGNNSRLRRAAKWSARLDERQTRTQKVQDCQL